MSDLRDSQCSEKDNTFHIPSYKYAVMYKPSTYCTIECSIHGD